MDEEEFDAAMQAGEFIEHAEYAGNRYGTLRSELEGADGGIVLEIDLQGARQIRDTLPEAVQVFIAPPSAEDLRRRLEARGSDSPQQIARRLELAEVELAAQQEFAKVVVNDDVERAVGELVELAATMCGPNGQATPT